MESYTVCLLILAWGAQLNSWFGSSFPAFPLFFRAFFVSVCLTYVRILDTALRVPTLSSPMSLLNPDVRGGSRPVAPEAIRRRQFQTSVFVGMVIYLWVGALFYRYHDSEQYPTLVQGLYFSTVTCTTIGYGEVTPDGVSARAFTICYSLFGIVGMGVFMIEMGEIFITASEVPTSAFLRRFVLHWCPGTFPGISHKAWRKAGLELGSGSKNDVSADVSVAKGGRKITSNPENLRSHFLV